MTGPLHVYGLGFIGGRFLQKPDRSSELYTNPRALFLP